MCEILWCYYIIIPNVRIVAGFVKIVAGSSDISYIRNNDIITPQNLTHVQFHYILIPNITVLLLKQVASV